ncbi:hypothetical protein CALCODRAFT_522073 [Calocera cornea HHB12733]|uniref:Uncharacterized protein n=1 Tax=Calocera cornea HHB12733 TaxID=1353952 RepID=A0A165C3Q9_9BASI|nr:hypothetical protein CALCODRAFT_522073 [Calocera cornea HHB12733]
MDVDEHIESDSAVEGHITGEELLESRPLDPAATKQVELMRVLDMAQCSARLCICESRAGMTTATISQCKDCLVTSCKRCGGRPTHNHAPYHVDRLSSTVFEKELKAALPMCLEFSIEEDDLDCDTLTENLTLSDEGGMSTKQFRFWKETVRCAMKDFLRFTAIKRQELWLVNYESTSARLELVLSPTSKPQWFLEFGLPITETLDVKVQGTGKLDPSFKSALGLQGAFAAERVWHTWKLTVDPDDAKRLDFDISGTYKLLPDWSTFLPRSQAGRGDFAKQDCYSFSSAHRRIDFGEDRPVVAALAKSWREHDGKGVERVHAYVKRHGQGLWA